MVKKYKIFCFLLVISLVVTILINNNKEDYDKANMVNIKNQQQKEFYKLKSQADSLAISLDKAKIIDKIEQKVPLLMEAYNSVCNIESSINQLSLNQENIVMTKKFLSQIKNYCQSVVKDELTEELSVEQKNQNKESLILYQEYVLLFSQAIKQAQKLYSNGELTMGMSLRNKIKDIYNPKNFEVESYFDRFEKIITDYYGDGIKDTYFEEIEKREQKIINTGDVGIFEAKEQAKKYINQNVKKIELLEIGRDSDRGSLPVYLFSSKIDNGNIMTAISRQGGNLIYMQNTRRVLENKINVEEAQKYANEYLKSIGFENIKLSHYQSYFGSITLHYLNIIDGIIVYPEKLRVRVALDNGEILGVETSKYYSNHYDRDKAFTTPQISIIEVRESIPKEFNVIEENMAIIFRENKKEVFCYEFIGEYEGSKYALYVNAKTNKQECINKFIDNINGTEWI